LTLYAALKRRSSTVRQAVVVVAGRTVLRAVVATSSGADPRAVTVASSGTGGGAGVVVIGFAAMNVFVLARFRMSRGRVCARREEG